MYPTPKAMVDMAKVVMNELILTTATTKPLTVPIDEAEADAGADARAGRSPSPARP